MIIVMGLPGAGKSSVLSAVPKDYKLVNYGDIMFSIAKKKYKIENRDQIRKLDPAKQKAIQAQVGRMLSKMKGKVILDTHCSIATPKGYLPGLPFSLLSKLKVELLVLISAPVDEIIARRQNDPTRARDAQTPQSLEEHDWFNKAFLASYSSFTGAPCIVIFNRQGRLQEAQQRLLSLL
ncbi:MAG: adenylate kinase [Candidatus Micrarchaeota archaeon]|nr:adenylate kinase [Candidatus Micrarchaeota archaeon]